MLLANFISFRFNSNSKMVVYFFFFAIVYKVQRVNKATNVQSERAWQNLTGKCNDEENEVDE